MALVNFILYLTLRGLLARSGFVTHDVGCKLAWSEERKFLWVQVGKLTPKVEVLLFINKRQIDQAKINLERSVFLRQALWVNPDLLEMAQTPNLDYR